MTPSAPPAGWYPDPNNADQLRYWDGAAWTSFSAERTPDATGFPGTDAQKRDSAAVRHRWRPSVSIWVIAALALLVAIIGSGSNGFGGFLIGVSLFGLGAGIWTVVRRRPSWLNLPRTRGAGWAAIGISTAVLLLGAAIAPHPQPIGQAQGVSAGTSIVATTSTTPTPTPIPTKKTTPSPTPTPTPAKTTQVAESSEQVAFNKTSYEDANIDAGTNVLVTAGVPGTKVSKWEITLIDGVETARSLVSEIVTVAPVDEVTAIGTRQAPPAPPAEPAPDEGGACDPNYSGACVPIASDVDCAGGSGNGPAYVSGPVQVVGTDIYDLDRNGDGIGCE